MTDTNTVEKNGLVLLGCGKMGSAMLKGWLEGGLSASAVTVLDPAPSDWVQSTGVHINSDLPEAPAVVLIAVKPQMIGDALPQLAALAQGKTLFISVAAGTTLGALQSVLGDGASIVRAMPNTPAAVAQGITAIIGNAHTDDAAMALAETLLEAIGEVVRLDDEAQMDAVTGVSGSGPAYVFHMIECLAAAGEAEGLPADLALKLARATVAGAGALAQSTDRAPGLLRSDVTSPNGTTQAGLEVLMEPQAGLPDVIRRTVAAAANRSRELGNDG